MSQALDERRHNILYHALGANFERGLQLFETAFEEAEVGFRLNEIESLLGILVDPTLQDERLPAWHRYFSARRAILLWQPDQAEAELQALDGEASQGSASLRLRSELLQAQIWKIRGQWPAARKRLKEIAKRAADEPGIRLTAYEWLAQSLMAQVVSSGGWARPKDSSPGKILQALLAVIFLPAYLAVMLLVGSARWLPVFWKAISRYATNYTNWPVLLAILEAYQALDKVQKLFVNGQDNRQVQTELLRAEVLRFAENTALSAKIYEKLLEANRTSKDPYLEAVLTLGLARVRLVGEKADADLAGQLLRARQAFLEFHDQRSIAFVNLLLGDIDIKAGLPEPALEKWKAAMQTFQDQGDPAGVASCLGRCYSALSLDLTQDQKHALESVVQGAQLRAFRLRLPTPFFRALEYATWLIPLLGGLAMFAGIAAYLATHERSQYRLLANRILSPEGLLVGCALLATMIALAAIVGLIGLLSTLRTAASRLDWFTVDHDILKYQHALGSETSIAIKDCRKIVQVERGFGSLPSDSLSYTLLESMSGLKLVIPGSTTWYRYLQETVVAISGISPSVYRLKLHGGAIFVFIASIFPILFLLIDLSLQPWLTVEAHAGLVTLGQVLSVLLILWVSIRWIRHFAQVYFETNTLPRFAVVAGGIAITLILLGVFGRKRLFPFDSIVLFWGIALLGTMLSLLALALGKRRLGPLARAGAYLIVTAGLGAALYSFVPLLLYTQAFVYAGAVQQLGPAQPGYELERAAYFEKMEIRSRQILQVDPSYRQAYGLLGLALQARGDFSNSLGAYTKYQDLTGSSDIAHCIALVHYLRGEQNEALQAYTMYLSGKEDPASPDYCDRYFPELKGVFARLE